MKSFLIIGMGRFGSHLCRNLAKLGNEVMIVDQNEELLEPLLPYVTDAKIGDCTKEEVLKSLGVGNFDKCFVCIGTNFQSSLEITCLLKELGAKYVISKATRDVHAKFLLRNGADKNIYPDRDIAEKCAVQYSSDSVFDYFELGPRKKRSKKSAIGSGLQAQGPPPITRFSRPLRSFCRSGIPERYSISSTPV